MKERKKRCGGVGDVLMRSATSNVDVLGNRASRACCRESAVHGRPHPITFALETSFDAREGALDRGCLSRFSAFGSNAPAAINMICSLTRPGARRPYKRRPPRQLAIFFSSSINARIHHQTNDTSHPSNSPIHLSHQPKPKTTFKMTGGKSGGKASGSKSSAQS